MILVTALLTFVLVMVVIAWHNDIRLLEKQIEILTEKLKENESSKNFNPNPNFNGVQEPRPVSKVQKRVKKIKYRKKIKS